MVKKSSTTEKIKEKEAKKEKKPTRYFEAVGRRKTAVARVRLSSKQLGILINEKTSQKIKVFYENRSSQSNV